MRKLLLVAAVLVFLAGIQLFVFPERTERYFAWTIDVPLTAAFLGAGYWASVGFEWLAAREKVWAYARVSVPAVFVFTAMTLVATLLHLDLFHFGGSFEIGTQVVTWAWLAIYVVVPVAMVLIWLRQRRVPGADPPRTFPLRPWMRALLVVHAVVMLGLGAYLFATPERGGAMWPWPLTPLTGRAVGAWLLGIGVAAAHSLKENDARRVRAAAVSYVALAVLQAIALARFPDTVSWGSSRAVIYLIILASMLAFGIGVLRDSARDARES